MFLTDLDCKIESRVVAVPGSCSQVLQLFTTRTHVMSLKQHDKWIESGKPRLSKDFSIMSNTPTPLRLPPFAYSPPSTPPQASAELDKMAPRKSLAPDPSSINVYWPNAGTVSPQRWALLPDRWKLLDDDCVNKLKAMIDDAMTFRTTFDQSASYASRADHTRAIANTLRKLVMNPIFHTLHSQIFKPNLKQTQMMKVVTWLHKRQDELGKYVYRFLFCHTQLSATTAAVILGHLLRPYLHPY
jgi:hypothetical protein